MAKDDGTDGIKGMVKKTIDSVKKEVPKVVDLVKTQTEEAALKVKNKTTTQQLPSKPEKKKVKKSFKLPEGTTVTLPGGQEYITHSESIIKKSE